MRQILYILLLILLSFKSYAQQEKKITKHWVNTSLINYQLGSLQTVSLNKAIQFENPSFGFSYSPAFRSGIAGKIAIGFGDVKNHKEVIFGLRSFHLGLQYCPGIKTRSPLLPYTGVGMGFMQKRINDVWGDSELLVPITVGLRTSFRKDINVFIEQSYSFANTELNMFAVGVQVSLSELKDSDGDGVMDKNDQCPEEKGTAMYSGCPKLDTDKDGIADLDDPCPYIYGFPYGCPDMDLDGVTDSLDLCPDVPGSAMGCPDKDKDGFADKDDLCPDVFGDNRGCPDNPLEEQVINQTEIVSLGAKNNSSALNETIAYNPDVEKSNKKENQRAPSSGREVNDKKNVKEMEDIDRARISPDIDESEELRAPNSLNPYILFNVASDRVKGWYKVQLIGWYRQLYKDPSAILLIDGYTDNQGRETYNEELSLNRAKAVQLFFINRGIAENRLRVEYFGPYNPRASNKYESGRKLNRRVELEIVKAR